ncbi:MAG: chromosome segregation protein SMC [Gammaproteobacteria bacterium]|nr:chromosome segregation protein SMC [Gammaproteobacteria bacterium]
MRLKHIKLSGFKSFVDPTSIPVSSNLIGVVGPNGCGKSNIIDAVRWVMGESSAKHLRGDSMADVIFSGSNTRKPVGKATVELIFDNSDGRAPGQYAAYAEISIKREASRDGQSNYFLNKTRCRRKDITDLFLGTGLGPRTYSIIEQGMVTRVVEAKPEDLRAFLEEAAGISKYKERRRDTENRIRHTKENLERVLDIRQELETQLQKLQRQSKAAAKYKEFKQEERTLRAQLLALRWRRLDESIKTHESALTQHDIELEGVIAGQREIEAAIESLRSQQTEANDHYNGVQGEFYSLGADISGIEQKIQHVRETRAQQQREQQQVNRSWEEASQHLTDDQRLLEQLQQDLQASEPKLAAYRSEHEKLAADLHGVEQEMHAWQTEWQRFNEMAAEPEKARGVQQTRIAQSQEQLETLRNRQSRLQNELADIERSIQQEDVESLRLQANALDKASEEQEQALEQIEARIVSVRKEGEDVASELEELRGDAQSKQARLESLLELQDAAQGKHDQRLNEWLQAQGVAQSPRLSGAMSVEAGWEKAVERVLGDRLSGICVDNFDKHSGALTSLEQSSLVLFDQTVKSDRANAVAGSLAQKVTSDVELGDFLGNILVAVDLAEALRMRASLKDHQSIVTRDGAWIGRNWVSLVHQEGARAGVLRRQKEIEQLEAGIKELQSQIDSVKSRLEQARATVQDLEIERDEQRKTLNERNRKRTEVHGQLGSKETHLKQLKARREQINQEQEEVQSHIQNHANVSGDAERLLSEAEALSGTHAQQREELEGKRNALQQKLEASRAGVNGVRDQLHDQEVEHQRLKTTYESTQQSVRRLESQLQQLIARREELEQALSNSDQPENELKQQLEEFLQKRMAVEERLVAARQAVTDLESAMREKEQARSHNEKQAQEIRERVEQERMAKQELKVRQDTLNEQLSELGFAIQDVMTELPAEATEEAWTEELDKVAKRIERLGPINLVAIEEFEEQSERKAYLDKQYNDLTEALKTLEDVIHKIDRETRTRFKETFDKVNNGLQTLFPRLFGGGHAYLELTGEDLLDTGVSIMARPPGKRNSTIHLLSGGEKALTAVSLIFSIFQLNPAPFCLLDEVDAPLDDANVERYSNTLKEMAGETQLIYVTHNKISMEIADLLLGVTMSEPGVSRLVAVDMDEAMEMVV